jgi:transcriptional regulator with XRE-family HTH domain
MIDKTTKLAAQNLRKYRVSSGLSQVDIAEKAKINSNYYAKIERAEIKPSIETYEKLAKALNLKSSDIFPF